MILMKKKTSKKKKQVSKKKAAEKTVKEKEPVKPGPEAPEPEVLQLDIPPEVSQEPAPAPKKEGGGLNPVIIAIAAIAVLAVAYYLFIMPRGQFVPGASVDEQTFLNNFADAENVYIVQDVRGVKSQKSSRNIMQCATDFAFSPIMGSKNVTHISFGDAGCIYAHDGSADTTTYEECFAMLPNGFTIYVQEGAHYSFYSNGILVGVNETYVDGTCGIHIV